MKTAKWFLNKVSLIVSFVILTGCRPATSIPYVPTPANPIVTAVISSPTSAPTNTPKPASTPVVTEIRKSDNMSMIYIPAGNFTMGSDNGQPDEAPMHQVYLDDYWIDTTEITNEMYGLCVEAGNCKPPLQTGSYTRTIYYGETKFANYPVIYVDWDMANAYCEWSGARLPTEAEWEKAARGEDMRIFPWGNAWDVQLHRRLNFADKHTPETTSDVNLNDGYRDTAPVGSYSQGKSPYGVYDMAGNVWEWVADWYDPLYYQSSPSNDPQGPNGPTRAISGHVLRGGSWVAADESIFHTSNRNGLEPTGFSESIGFRCAR